MIAAGLQLMVLGMTIVFVFLIFLVFLMNIMSSIIRKIDDSRPQPVTAGTTTAPRATSLAPGSFDTHIPAVLAAVAVHRSRIGRAADGSASNTTTSKGASS